MRLALTFLFYFLLLCWARNIYIYFHHFPAPDNARLFPDQLFRFANFHSLWWSWMSCHETKEWKTSAQHETSWIIRRKFPKKRIERWTKVGRYIIINIHTRILWLQTFPMAWLSINLMLFKHIWGSSEDASWGAKGWREKKMRYIEMSHAELSMSFSPQASVSFFSIFSSTKNSNQICYFMLIDYGWRHQSG